MGIFRVGETGFVNVKDEEKSVKIIKKKVFDSFNPDILGLGKIDIKSKQVNALSVIFDLEGFTNFCKQIDPHLAVPEYLSDFLAWIFKKIREESIQKSYKEGYTTYSDLPFLSKYLGDGVLFLWDTEKMSDTAIRNVVVSMYEVCIKYQTEFIPIISKKITSAPTKLRCGIARGTIYSVGNGSDYVGPCINMSARLQKLNSLTFCFSRRGIDPGQLGEGYKDRFLVKKVNIRGIGDDELVCISRIEFNKLEQQEKDRFKNI